MDHYETAENGEICNVNIVIFVKKKYIRLIEICVPSSEDGWKENVNSGCPLAVEI